MIRYLPLLLLASLHASDKETEEFLHSLPQPPVEEVLSFLEATPSTQEVNPKKCSFPSDLPQLFASTNPSPTKLFIFTSFSVPLETWKEQSLFLEKTGGYFVLRGLPENSFPTLSKKITELRKAGIRTELLLDPESFEKYTIDAVPSIVLDNGKHYDKASGNLQPFSVLELFANSGDTKDDAQQLLKRMGVN